MVTDEGLGEVAEGETKTPEQIEKEKKDEENKKKADMKKELKMINRLFSEKAMREGMQYAAEVLFTNWVVI